MSANSVRVFIGSGEASVLERKTLIYSLRKNTRRPLDLYVFNGTHNAVEHNDEPPRLAPMSLRVKYQNFTEFSLYRFLIPQLCNHEGRAIFLDSDMICLADAAELFDTPMNGAAMMCIKAYDTGHWGTSVLLLDCSKCRFDLEEIFDEIDRGRYSYSDFTQLTEAFLSVHPHPVRELDPNWNVFDRCDENTKLIHYTHLTTQPWKYPGHPYGALWFQYHREAVENGFITEVDIQKATWRGYARLDIQQASQATQQPADETTSVMTIEITADAVVAPPLKRAYWLKRLRRTLMPSR
jgi:hypothetical protein